MYTFICKECGKSFQTIRNTQRYCSNHCSNIFRAKEHYKNLIGKKFGNLTVLEVLNKRKYNSVVCKCLCDCGNLTEASLSVLTTKRKKSCGCLVKKTSPKNSKNAKTLYKKEDTLLYLLNQKVHSNSVSGVKGVYKLKNGLYRVDITLNKKKHCLGNFKDLNKAIKVRKEAEEKYFKPILDKYKKDAD